jgi:hypothetical protein
MYAGSWLEKGHVMFLLSKSLEVWIAQQTTFTALTVTLMFKII